MDILNQYSEYRHSLKIWKVIPLILLVLGTLGNVLTIVVLMRSKSRLSSTVMYLTALAISDLLVLWTGLLRQWIFYMFDKDVRDISEPGCKIHNFLVYVSTQCSSWILVAVTTQRFIAAWLPHKFKQGCTRRIAGVTISVIVLCLVLLNVHWFYGMGVKTIVFKNVTLQLNCYPLNDNYYNFLVFQWPWIDLCIFSLVPFSVLLLGNVSVIIRLLISKYRTRTQNVSRRGETTGSKIDKTTKLTLLLLMLNLIFIICTMPISIYQIGKTKWIKEVETLRDYAVLELWWAVVNSFMYLNSTVNFILYFLSVPRFRQEVKSLVCCGRAGALFGRDTSASAGSVSIPMRTLLTQETDQVDCATMYKEYSTK